MTSPLLSRSPRAKSPTQPLQWDWVAAWSELDGRLRDLEARQYAQAPDREAPGPQA